MSTPPIDPKPSIAIDDRLLQLASFSWQPAPDDWPTTTKVRLPITWESLNNYFEAQFTPAIPSTTSILIPAVYQTPGMAGGSIMARRKKRFRKKQIAWLALCKRLSIARFMEGITR